MIALQSSQIRQQGVNSWIQQDSNKSMLLLANDIDAINSGTPGALFSAGASATPSAIQLMGGLIICTAAVTTITLPTAALLGVALNAIKGTQFDFEVDNTVSAGGTATVAVAAGIVAAKQVSSGDTAVDVLLTVANSSTVGIGLFRLVFSSPTAAVLFRIG